MNKSPLIIFYCCLFFSFLLMGACTTDRSGLPPSTGKTNELLIVVNNEEIEKGPIGTVLKDFFGRYLDGLPQPEETFDVSIITETAFTKMFKTHHNIFIVDVNPSFKRKILETHQDLWAKPQRVIKMTIPDEETFFPEFELHKESFMELFNANERRRAIIAFGSIENVNITKTLRERHNIHMTIPKNFFIAKQTEDFIWLRFEALQYSQGILIYYFPYTDTMVFQPGEIIRNRNIRTRQHVPGPLPGSFMKVSMVEPPITRRIQFNGAFAVEMRGLWDLEGDFMGGPFINYTIVDEKNQRIVTLDGYVYYPARDKKNLLRQVESIIFTYQPEIAKPPA